MVVDDDGDADDVDDDDDDDDDDDGAMVRWCMVHGAWCMVMMCCSFLVTKKDLVICSYL